MGFLRQDARMRRDIRDLQSRINAARKVPSASGDVERRASGVCNRHRAVPAPDAYVLATARLAGDVPSLSAKVARAEGAIESLEAEVGRLRARGFDA